MVESLIIPGATSRFIVIEGVRTHYLEAGDGPTLVLLHDGAYGGSAEISWFQNFEALSRHYRVIAPDFLGFGETDKLHDFGGGRARRVRHLTKFIETMDITSAAFCGVSLGATLLYQALTSDELNWPVKAAICVSGGGFIPFNEARKQTLDFDCTIENMRSIMSIMIHNEKWLRDERVIDARFRSATLPGAWEVTAAARFRSPITPARADDFGVEDRTPYERISVPVLVMAGENDRLKEPGYAAGLAARIPQSELVLFPDCGHFPNIEYAETFNRTVLDYLGRVYPHAG